MRGWFALLCWLLMPGPVWGAADLCRAPIAAVERVTGVPDRLMQAIAIIETGRRDAGGAAMAWPWSINVEGVGEIFDSKAAAIAAVQAHQARGARSIDVGCMQVNLMHHPEAFASLDEAFDPAANARYAAQFLQRLLAQTGSWPLAVAGYHSLTPEVGGDYARKVMAVWAKPELGQGGRMAAPGGGAPGPMNVAAASPGVSMPVAPAPAPMGGAMGGRLFTTPGAAMPATIGRGLDSYRAMPTRLAATGLLGRS